MMNNIWANTAKEVLQFIGESGPQISEQICGAIVKSKCCKLETAVAVIKEVTKDMTVFSQISDQFFDAYAKTLKLIEFTHQTTVNSYMVMLANDDSITLAEKAALLLEIQKESNKSSIAFYKIMAGVGVAGVSVAGGMWAYGKHCNAVTSMAKSKARVNIVKHSSPFAGANELLFAIADVIKCKG